MKKFCYEYPRPSVATDIAVFTLKDGELHVALIKRGEDPFKGMLALPGGFLRPEEDLDSCALRELQEETGAEGRLFQFANFSSPDRDPRGWVLSVAYFALVPSESVQLLAGSDAAAVEWLPLSEICQGSKPKVIAELAFDHKKILEMALAELSARALSTGIVFDLLPKQFTLSQMQSAVEAIVKWNVVGPRTVDKRNFRRWVANSNLVRKAGGVAPTGRRPAQLYSARHASR